MSKNIKTQEAKLDLITKFLDYANVADASYAMLQYVWENIEQDEKNNIYKADKLTLGDKIKQDIVVKNNKGKDAVKPKNTNTAYACAIQARFEQSKIIKKDSYCIPFVDTCFFYNEITLNNDISRVGLNDTLSKRTIEFVNRFRLLKHQPNTTSGFSATLFEDTKDNNQKIIVMRGTEFPSDFKGDVIGADKELTLGKVPYEQYLDMIQFYSECAKEFPNIKEDRGLIIVGHSLGGALAQVLTLSLVSANFSANVKEVYTFNSPGAKELRAYNLNQIYKIDEELKQKYLKTRI